MIAVFDWALTNAALAALLAIPAYASTILRRPAVTHALWILVLLRLIAPPVWQVPFSIGTQSAGEPVGTVAAPPIVGDPEISLDDGTEPVLSGEPIATEPTVVSEAPVVESPMFAVPEWRSVLATVWAAGAVGCLVLAVRRVRAFHKLVRHTEAAPDAWIAEAAPIATQLGLRKTPQTRLVNGSVAPLLWAGFGRPVLLLPATLTRKMRPDRRAALIAHELAHLRRGDHYVRWLELLVTVLFWWHPVVWFARRELREAEEQLCDAWVVWALPEARRAYASALVDTVDFLSQARLALPPLASGLGEVRNLKRRIVMIMRGQVPRHLTRLVLAIGFGIGLCALAVAPGRAQDPPRPPAPPDAPQPPEPPGGRARARLDPQKAEEAEQIRQEMRKMRDAMARLENRLAELEGRPAPRATGGGAGVRGRGPAAGGPDGFPGGGPPPGGPGDQPKPGMAPGARGFGGGGMAGGGFGGGPPMERRMEEMQRSIEQLNRELGEIRRLLRERGGPGGPGGRDGSRGGPPTPPPAPPAPPPPDGRGELPPA